MGKRGKSSDHTNSLSASPTKIAKHTQTICWLPWMNCLSVFGHFVGLELKGESYICIDFNQNSETAHKWRSLNFTGNIMLV